MFQVSNVIDACCAFLERQLDPTNAIGIANFAEQHGCTTLKQRANQFIERHFTQVITHSYYKNIEIFGIEILIFFNFSFKTDFTRRRIPSTIRYPADTTYTKG